MYVNCHLTLFLKILWNWCMSKTYIIFSFQFPPPAQSIFMKKFQNVPKQPMKIVHYHPSRRQVPIQRIKIPRFESFSLFPPILKEIVIFFELTWQKWLNLDFQVQIIMVFFTKNLELGNGILLPKLFWPTVRKNCSSDREKHLKFEAEGWEFSKFWDHLNNLFKQWKVRTIFGNRMLF